MSRELLRRPCFDRRTFLRLAAGSGLGLVAAGCTSQVAPAVPESLLAPPAAPAILPAPPPPVAPAVATPRNLLLITVDTWRADHAGAYGANVQTPMTDRLAADGVRFANAHVQLPQTTPSHTALFTGQYPATNGVRISQHESLGPNATTLTTVLAQAGYRTGGVHSWYSLHGPLIGLDRGFDSYSGQMVRLGTKELVAPEEAVAAWRRGVNAAHEFDGRADLTTDAAIQWLDEAAKDSDRPFFLWVHYRDPHYPYLPPPPYDTLYGADADGSFAALNPVWEGARLSRAQIERIVAAYDGELSFTDQEVGRLLERLDSLGATPRTLVALTADHGEAFAEHDEWFHGTRLYQTTVHVPLLLRLPGVLPAGATVHAAAQAIDVLPTALELLELPTPPAVEGRSLLPAVQGERLDDYVAVAEVADRRYNAVVHGEWKLIRDRETGRRSLYHLPSDPAEQTDRFAGDQATAAHLEGLLRQWDSTHR